MSGKDYDQAYDEMINILQNKKVLVLVDSMDYYDLSDIKVVIPVKALVAICFDYYKNNTQNRIHVNIALPSEVYTRILNQLPGKQQSHVVVIHWRYSNLINFIAIRLFDWCINNNEKNMFDFAKSYNIQNFFGTGTDTTNALEFLYNILPAECSTSLDFNFDTFPYCIRHTLKKPRELMIIFNAFIEKILKTGNYQYFWDNQDEIKKYIHSTQEDLVGSALSMYSTMYPNIESICKMILGNHKFLFVEKNIENEIKDAVVRFPEIDGVEIKRILLESGLIGVVNNVKPINLKGKNVKGDLVITNISARFEYQIKGKLDFNKNDYYVIHPMCYEHFTCYLDPKALVYADISGDESDVLHNILKRE